MEAKILIAFAGKTGTTEKCAKMLQGKVPNSVVCDLNKEKPELSQYGAVILGASIRMGMIHKAAKAWFAANQTEIMSKPYALFICNGFPDQAPQFLLQNYGEDVVKKAVCHDTFGGEMDLAHLKGMDKFIAKAVTNANKKNNIPEPKILTEKMDQFAKVFVGTISSIQ